MTSSVASLPQTNHSATASRRSSVEAMLNYYSPPRTSRTDSSLATPNGSISHCDTQRSGYDWLPRRPERIIQPLRRKAARCIRTGWAARHPKRLAHSLRTGRAASPRRPTSSLPRQQQCPYLLATPNASISHCDVAASCRESSPLASSPPRTLPTAPPQRRTLQHPLSLRVLADFASQSHRRDHVFRRHLRDPQLPGVHVATALSTADRAVRLHQSEETRPRLDRDFPTTALARPLPVRHHVAPLTSPPRTSAIAPPALATPTIGSPRRPERQPASASPSRGRSRIRSISTTTWIRCPAAALARSAPNRVQSQSRPTALNQQCSRTGRLGS